MMTISRFDEEARERNEIVPLVVVVLVRVVLMVKEMIMMAVKLIG